MRTITYQCNLCLEKKDKRDLLAFYFKCDIIPQRFVLSDNIDSCDKHLCINCCEIIKKELEIKQLLKLPEPPKTK